MYSLHPVTHCDRDFSKKHRHITECDRRVTHSGGGELGGAVLAILEHCEAGEWELIISEMVETEVAQIADSERRQRIEGALLMAQSNIEINDTVASRGQDLQSLGFKGFDAIHLACAEIAQADVFLSTEIDY